MILKTWSCFKAYKAFDLSHLCSPPALQREKLRNVNYVKYSVKSFEMSKSCAYTHRHFHLLKTSCLLPQLILVLGGCTSSWERAERRGRMMRTECSPSPIPSGLLLLFLLSKCNFLIQIPSGMWGQQEQPPACSGLCISEASMAF